MRRVTVFWSFSQQIKWQLCDAQNHIYVYKQKYFLWLCKWRLVWTDVFHVFMYCDINMQSKASFKLFWVIRVRFKGEHFETYLFEVRFFFNFSIILVQFVHYACTRANFILPLYMHNWSYGLFHIWTMK